MAKRTVRYSLSARDIRRAAKAIQARSETLSEAEKDIVEQLTEIGLTEAKAAYAGTEYAGNLSYTVEAYQTGRGTVAIRAKGPAIAYIEFGAGKDTDAYPGTLPPGITGHGKLSHQNDETHHHNFHKDSAGEHWAYKGLPGSSMGSHPVMGKTRAKTIYGVSREGLPTEEDIPSEEYEKPGIYGTYGNDPAPGLYNAKVVMVKHLEKILGEVLDKYHD